MIEVTIDDLEIYDCTDKVSYICGKLIDSGVPVKYAKSIVDYEVTEGKLEWRHDFINFVTYFRWSPPLGGYEY